MRSGGSKCRSKLARMGYWERQKNRTDANIRRRLNRHLSKHPKDGVAKRALEVRGG